MNSSLDYTAFKIPSFAKDVEVWEYVIGKVYDDTGKTPDDYSKGRWMAVNKMYQNACRKYRDEAIEQKQPATPATPPQATVAKDCVFCETLKPHDVDDYCCRDCRDKMNKGETVG